jgi:hypothetical protein
VNTLQLAAHREHATRLDTYPDHWRCRKCESAEPHVHKERADDGVWHWRDYGYDTRDEE